jgi:amino acid adenylation domain-containing protein
MKRSINNIRELPISEYQKRFFLEWSLSPDEDTYNLSYVKKLTGNLNLKKLKKACEFFIACNEVVHAQYSDNGDSCYYGNFSIDEFYHELTFNPGQTIELQIRELLYKPFDLTKDVLLRLYLMKSDDHDSQEYYFLFVAHHILWDATSVSQFFNQIENLYNELSNGNNPSVHVDNTFTHAVNFERAKLAHDYKEEARKFWLDFIGDTPIKLHLPYRSNINHANLNSMFADKTGEVIYFDLSISQTEGLRTYAKEKGTTLFIVLSSLYGLILSKYCNQKRFLISYPIDMRPAQFREVMGCFTNNVAHKFQLDDIDTLGELIKSLGEQRKTVKNYQGYSMTDIIQDQRKYFGREADGFFNVGFGETYLNSAPLKIKNVEVLPVNMPWSTNSISEIGLFYDRHSPDVIKFKIEYRTPLFDKRLMGKFIISFTNAIDELISKGEIFIKNYSVLHGQQYERIIYEWNQTDRDYPTEKTIQELFEDQAAKTPDNIALVYEKDELSYAALNAKSNQLARFIRDQYQEKTRQMLKPDTLIALCMHRNLEMVVGILAVLKAGGAYVPIDPSYPQERIDYLLSDTQAALVVSQRHLVESGTPLLPVDKIIYADLSEDLYREQQTENLAAYNSGKDLAYVIYTSGTTGRPKGVMVEHRSVINLALGQAQAFEINADSKVLQFASLVFDASVWEIFSTLSFGAALFILSSGVRQDADLVSEYMESCRINIATLPPALLSSITYKEFVALRTLIVAGEPCALELMRLWSQGRNLINGYGPTENTVCASMHKYETGDLNTNIGRPFNNVSVYVLDMDRNPVPIGVTGELYIGGAGLSRGYLNNRELTQERFVSNPFATQADKAKGYTRLYRTGDLVRWLSDGNLEYIGRNDEQVKIRGYRIEPGEIEQALISIEGIKQACVLARVRKTDSGSTKYLVGYYVSDSEFDSTLLTPSFITGHLSRVLPEYMMPAKLVPLETFPLTINGKLDKRALPDPEFTSMEEYVAPSSETESALVKIWQEVLGVEKVGMTDDFFRIGGNSILAIQVSHRMSQASGSEIKVADVFKYRTPSRLVSHCLGQTLINIPKTVAHQSPLSFAQERLWFIEQYEQGTNAYHIPALFELAADTDVRGLKYALQQIVARHEVLRSTIERGEDQQGIQVVHTALLTIDEIICTDKDLEALIKEAINRPFDLRSEYPIRVKLYKIEPGSGTILLINIHHIACDGWSIGIFQKELFAWYEAYINNDKKFSLPDLDIQYKDYAVWQRTYLKGEILEKQLNYWKNKLTDYQTLELPTDYTRPNQVDYRGSRQVFSLTREVSDKLRALARMNGVTMHSVLLSSINILLSKYTGQEDIIIGSPIANRQYRQTKNLIGFFVNMQVNRTVLNKFQSYEELIRQVHQEQIEGQLHQDLPFEKLVDELEFARDPARHAVFQVMFVVQSFGYDRKANGEQKKYFRPFHGSVNFQAEKFDLSIFIDDSQKELQGEISYATSLFGQETIVRLIEHFTHLIDELVEAPRKAYSQISLPGPEEYERIIYEWNKTDTEYPGDKTIHELFEEQAERTPDNVALVYEGKQLTYRELNEYSNQLAHHIRKQYRNTANDELRPDTLIALYLNRSLEMVVSILAVLKAGAAYVPIDTSYPKDRVNYILDDTEAPLVLTQRQLTGKDDTVLPKEKILLTDLTEELYIREKTDNLPSESNSSSLAYVIYTSGTTGKPKGVMVEHKAVLSLVYNDFINLTPNDVFVFLSSPVFDAATFELWTPLLNGNMLTVVGDTKELASDINKFRSVLVSYNISILWLTRTLFESLYYSDNTLFKDLNYLIIGGEALDRNIINRIVESPHKPRHFLNGYGPTESTTFTCIYNLSNFIRSSNVPIGRPIDKRKAYVLDNNQVPLPIGAIGELYIGGAGIARGYLKRPELTAERFIVNPFATAQDKTKGYTRLYKTGDLVKWLPDGNLEFIGRNDDQVKIRGYRIELGEIENALSQIEGVRQSCVLVKESKTDSGVNNYLVGYYVLDRSYVSTKDGSTVDSWERLFDTEYEKDIETISTESDFSGWNSYITGLAFPLSEMQLWKNGIIAIINTLRPGNVLEIGVGSGLLMYPLLPVVKKYTGLDISESVIARHKNYLKNKNYKFELFHLRANQLDELPKDEKYDTIILNSVCQYFPNIQYFNSVLQKAIGRLSENGSIFLGDIRNYDLHKALIQEKLDYNPEYYMQKDIDRIALKENELLISPGYFTHLQDTYETIKVNIIERGENYINELSKYRYDVVISLQGEAVIDHDKKAPPHTYNVPFLNQLSKEQIYQQLSAVLPSYMVPNALVMLDNLPLTVNGKLDKRALPDPAFSHPDEHEAPVTETQIALCRIWQDVLGLEQPGIRDDFFRVGGNSINAIQVSHRISKKFGVEFTIKDIFMCPTIASITDLLVVKSSPALISAGNPSNTHSGTPDIEQTLYYTLPLQSFRYLAYRSGNIGRMNTLITKNLHDVDEKALSMTLDTMVSRHESLRAVFLNQGETVLQKICSADTFIPTLTIRDMRGQHDKDEKIEKIINELSVYRFDFEKEPSFKCILIKHTEDKSLFIFVIDHIIYDAHSLKLIEKEIFTIYDAYSKGLPNPFEPLTCQLKDFIDFYRKHYEGDKLTYHKVYFQNLLKDVPERLKIKSNDSVAKNPFKANTGSEAHNPVSIEYSEGGGYRFVVPKEILHKIHKRSAEMKVSFYNFMLASYSIFLSKVTFQNDFIIDSPMSTRSNEDHSKIIGWLTGTLVTRIKVNENSNFNELLNICSNAFIDAVDHIYYQDFINPEWFHIATQLNVLNDFNTVEGRIEDLHSSHFEIDNVFFDITFIIEAFENGLLITCVYRRNFIDKSQISDVCEKFLKVLNLAINSPNDKFRGWSEWV